MIACEVMRFHQTFSCGPITLREADLSVLVRDSENSVSAATRGHRDHRQMSVLVDRRCLFGAPDWEAF